MTNYLKALGLNKTNAYVDVAAKVADSVYKQAVTASKQPKVQAVPDDVLVKAQAAKEVVSARIVNKAPKYGNTELSSAPTGVQAAYNKFTTALVPAVEKVDVALSKVDEFKDDVINITKTGALSAVANIEKKVIETGLMISEQDWSINGVKKRAYNFSKYVQEIFPDATIFFPKSEDYKYKEHPETDFERVLKDSYSGWSQWEKDSYDSLDNKAQKNIAELISIGLTMSGAIALTVFTENPKVGAALMAGVDTTGEYVQAREAGLAPNAAANHTAKSFAWSMLSEKIMFDKYLGGAGKGITGKILTGLKEGVQEDVQLLGQDILSKIDYEKDFSTFDDYFKSFWMAAVTGTGVDVVIGKVQKKAEERFVEKLSTDYGVTKERAKQFADNFRKYGEAKAYEMMKEPAFKETVSEARTVGLKGGRQGIAGIDYPAPIQTPIQNNNVELERNVPTVESVEEDIKARQRTLVENLKNDEYYSATYGEKGVEVAQSIYGAIEEVSNSMVDITLTDGKITSLPEWLPMESRNIEVAESYFEKLETGEPLTTKEQSFQNAIIDRASGRLSTKGIVLDVENAPIDLKSDTNGGVSGSNFVKRIVGERVLSDRDKLWNESFKQRVKDRSKIEKLEFDIASKKAYQQDLIRYVKSNVPLAVRGRNEILYGIKNVNSTMSMLDIINKADKIAGKYEAKSAEGKIKKLLKKTTQKVKDGKLVKQMDSESQVAINKLREAINAKKTYQEAYAEYEAILADYQDTDLADIPANVLKEAHLALISGIYVQGNKTKTLANVKIVENAYKQIKSIVETGKSIYQKQVENFEELKNDITNDVVADVTSTRKQEGKLVEGIETGTLQFDTTADKNILKSTMSVVSKALSTIEDSGLGFINAVAKATVYGKKNIGEKIIAEYNHQAGIRDGILVDLEPLAQHEIAKATGEVTGWDVMKVIKKWRKKKVLVNPDGSPHIRFDKKSEYTDMQLAYFWALHNFKDESVQKTLSETMKFNESTWAAIEATMSKGVKEFSNGIVENVFPAIGDVISPVYEKQMGVPLKRAKGYVHRLRKDFEVEDSDGINLMSKSEMDDMVGITPSFAKVATGSNKPFVAADLLALVERDVKKAAYYAAFNDFVRTYGSVFNKTEVKYAFEQKNIKNTLSVINNALKNITRGEVQKTENKYIKPFENGLRRFVGGVMFGNVISGVKQTASIFSMYGNKDLSVNEISAGIAEYYKHFNEYTEIISSNPTVRQRASKGFSAELAFSKKGVIKTTKRIYNISPRDKSAWGKIVSGVGRAWDSFGGIATKGDTISVIGAGAPLYIAYKNKYAKTMDINKAESLAIDKTVEFIKRNFQSGDIGLISEIQSQTFFGKLLTTFQSFGIQATRESIQTVREMLAGKTSVAKGARYLVMVNYVMPMIMQFIASGFRWDWEDQKETFFMGPLNNLPFFGPLARKLILDHSDEESDYISAAFPAAGIVKSAVDTGVDTYKASTGGGSWAEAFGSTFKLVGQATGKVPATQGKNIIEGVADYVSGESIDPRRLFYSSFSLSEGELLAPKGNVKYIDEVKSDKLLSPDQLDTLSKDLDFLVKEKDYTVEEANKIYNRVIKAQEYITNSDKCVKVWVDKDVNYIAQKMYTNYQTGVFDKNELNKLADKLRSSGIINKDETAWLKDVAVAGFKKN